MQIIISNLKFGHYFFKGENLFRRSSNLKTFYNSIPPTLSIYSQVIWKILYTHGQQDWLSSQTTWIESSLYHLPAIRLDKLPNLPVSHFSFENNVDNLLGLNTSVKSFEQFLLHSKHSINVGQLCFVMV